MDKYLQYFMTPTAIVLILLYIILITRNFEIKLVKLERQKRGRFIRLRMTFYRLLIWFRSISFCTEKPICESCKHNNGKGTEVKPCQKYLNKSYVSKITSRRFEFDLIKEVEENGMDPDDAKRAAEAINVAKKKKKVQLKTD